MNAFYSIGKLKKGLDFTSSGVTFFTFTFFPWKKITQRPDNNVKNPLLLLQSHRKKQTNSKSLNNWNWRNDGNTTRILPLENRKSISRLRVFSRPRRLENIRFNILVIRMIGMCQVNIDEGGEGKIRLNHTKTALRWPKEVGSVDADKKLAWMKTDWVRRCDGKCDESKVRVSASSRILTCYAW